MPTCLQCGREIAANAPYCSSCGAPAAAYPGASSAYQPPRASPSPDPQGPPATSTKAIVGFVLSLMPCFLFAIPALILSIMARGDIKRSNGSQSGGGLALAGIILSAVWLTFGTVGVLAAIAIPNYIKFQARSKQAEAKAATRVLVQAIQDYKEAHGGQLPTSFAELGWKPDSTRYTYYLGEDRSGPLQGELLAIPKWVDVSSAVVVVVGNVDNDPIEDVWAIDKDGLIEHLQDDVTDLPMMRVAEFEMPDKPSK